MSNKLTKDAQNKIIAALRTNPNASQVAREIGDVSHTTIGKIARAAGIELIAGKAARGRPLAPARRVEIVAALRVNPNATQVARSIGGVSDETVRQIAKAEGIELTAKGRPTLTPEKRACVVAALRVNPNAAEVARAIGDINHMTVWRIAKVEGLTLMPQGRRPPAPFGGAAEKSDRQQESEH